METLHMIWEVVVDFFSNDTVATVAKGLLILLGAWWVGRAVSKGLEGALRKKLSAQHLMLLRRGVFYTILMIGLFMSLQHIGLDLGVLLGAAGILTVAIGFASQTSASNLISGLFLIVEQPFVVGDTIRVGTTTGIVLSVDLLSVKLRTFDNLFVRVPNETLVKSEITNLSHFPVRRYDLIVGVAYKEDLKKVRGVLLKVAEENNLVLDEPEPLILFQGFMDSAITFQFSVWATRENFPDVRNQVPVAVKAAFDAANIEIPFPHRTLYTGSVTEPLPVALITQHQEAS